MIELPDGSGEGEVVSRPEFHFPFSEMSLSWTFKNCWWDWNVCWSFWWGIYRVHCWWGASCAPRCSIYSFGLWSYWKVHDPDAEAERDDPMEGGWGPNWELLEEV